MKGPPLLLLMPLAAQAAFYLNLDHVNFGVYAPNEKLQLYGNSDDIQSLAEESEMMGEDVWAISAFPLDSENEDLSSIIGMQCTIVHDIFFRNSPEVLPLTNDGSYYIDCLPDVPLEHGTQYGIHAMYTVGDSSRSVFHRDISFEFDENATPRKSRFSQQMEEDLMDAAEAGYLSGHQRSLVRGDAPKITGILPKKASPKGGVYLTIYGTNLKSSKIDLGGTSDKEASEEGEDYVIWLEYETDRLYCRIDRMLTLHGRPLDGQDFVVCETPELPKWRNWKVYMIIDGGATLYAGSMDLTEANSPTVKFIYPGAAAPAKPKDEWDYHGQFWTSWYNTDSPDIKDGVEDETLQKIQTRYRSDFQHCINPIGIEVYDVENDESYIASENNNADGKSTPEYNSAFYGFKCSNALQTLGTDGNPLAACVDVKVRFLCIPGTTELIGRIYTDVHGREDAADFHANRLHETPKVVDESDGFKAELSVHLNDGENCGAHANCGRNQRLKLKVISGMDGVYQVLPKAAIPGAYNLTYQTLENGKAVMSQYLLNYLTNEDLYPVTFEIYPQIRSVSPQTGSLTGGTLLTIKGTGFVTDGLGGTVDVTVGDDKCKIESITETEILCRTIVGEEEPATFSDSRVFVNTDGYSTSENQRKYWSLAWVSSGDQCKTMCKDDASCWAYIFQKKDATWNGCWHIDYFGLNKTDGTDWFNEKWYPWLNSEAGHIDPASRSPEYSCYTGRGAYYEGNATLTEYDTHCIEGTFCRNPSPNTHIRPYCKDTEQNWRSCRLLRCDQVWGKYKGNRGLDVRMALNTYAQSTNLEIIRNAELALYHYTAPNSKIHAGKYHNGNHGYWGGHETMTDVVAAKVRTNFIAPYDGVYKFIFMVDDSQRGQTGFDSETGSYTQMSRIDHHCGLFDNNCRHLPWSHSDRYTLKKGDALPIQVEAYQGSGPGYMNIAVQYLGKDETSGTWIDHTSKNDMNQDTYRYEKQEIKILSDYRHDRVVIFMKFDDDLINDGTGLESGETFSAKKRAQLRLKFCGDDNNCFTTPTLSADDADHPDKFEDVLEDLLEEKMENICKKSGSMNPELYHGTYEDDEPWPSHHHFHREAGSWCGYKAHELHNHDFYNYHINGEFSTEDYNDLCMAHFGPMQQIAVYTKYIQSHNDKEWKGWIYYQSDWKGLEWTWICKEISVMLDSALEHHGLPTRKEGTHFFDIRYMRPINTPNVPVYVDEVRIGKMRQELVMEQTTKQITFDGQVPYRVDVDKSNYDDGCKIQITWITSDSRAQCGYTSKLPTVLPPDGSNFKVHADSDSETLTTGSDWTESNPLPVNLVDPNLGSDLWSHFHVEPEASKNYVYGRINYVDANDNVRHIMHVHVLKRSDVDEDVAGTAELFYGNDPEPYLLKFGKEGHQKTVQADLHERWPELNNEGLITRVYRSGWCQYGYTYAISTHDHGRMKPFTIGTITYDNTRMLNVRHEAVLVTDPGVITWTMPGSVTATEHHFPQVVVMANGQRSACDNCDFVYSAMYTPTISAITDNNGDEPTTVSKGTSLTLTYDLKSYTGTRDNMQVLIGSTAMVNCNTPTTTSVTCDVGNVPEGTHYITLRIPENGDAVSSSTVLVEKVVSSHSPTVGSQHGGTVITVLGSGFEANQVVSVDVGGALTECDSTGFEVSYSELICRTSANADIANGNTPSLSEISLNKFTIHGGEQFTLTGADLTNDDECTGKVFVGATEATVISWSDTTIVAETAVGMSPDMDADTFVYVCNKGYTNVINTSVQLRATSVSASFSSLNGGRKVTIDGFGFATTDVEATSVSVLAGSIPCEVESATKSKIICSTGPHFNRHELKLAGSGISDLVGNDASSVTIEVGNEVHWNWNIQIPGTVPVVHFQSVTTSGDAETTTDTFWSESFSGSTGNFVKQFLTEGEYHYSTGYLDSATIYQSGTITVVGATDKIYKLSILVNGVETEHKKNSDNVQPSDTCNTSGGSSTAAADPGPGYHMTYSWATTPVLSSFSVDSPFVEGLNAITYLPFIHSPVATISIDMAELDTTACGSEVSVMISEFNCDHDSTSGNQLSCTINPDDTLDVTKMHKMSINVNDMGNVYYYDYSVHPNNTELVYLDVAFDISFGAYVDSTSLTEMSKFGDVELTLTGNGFVSEKEVNVFFLNAQRRSFSCKKSTVTYTSLTCKLERIVSGETGEDFQLDGYVGYVGRADIFGTFDFTDAATPKVESINPTSVSTADQVVTVTGSVLSGLAVTVGGLPCSGIVVAEDLNSATCTLPDLASGVHQVQFTATNGFVVTPTITLESSLTVSAISPNSGGTNGGSLVTLSGFGFDQDTVVQVYTADGEILCEFCYKESVTPAEIVFLTPSASNEGPAEVRVSHEYLVTNIAPLEFTFATTTASVTGASSGLTNLAGGENLVIIGSDFGTCSNIKLELVIPKDPCADGQHYCPWNAQCSPTTDGTDYTCECNASTDKYEGYGSGLQCYNFNRYTTRATFEEAEQLCTDSKQRVFNVQNKNDEIILKELLVVLEGSSTRGVFFKWYGADTCGHLDGDGEFAFPGDCTTWGSESDEFKKRVICKYYTSRNCYDAEIDNGKYSYNGKVSKSFTGMTCKHWADTDGEQDDTNYDSDNNYCRNNNDWSAGINCFGYTTTYGDPVNSSCGIPKCNDMKNGLRQQQCKIKSMAPIQRDDIKSADTHPWDGDCWIGSMGSDYAVHNPRRCYDYGRNPEEFRLQAVDESRNIYKIVRQSGDKYIYASGSDDNVEGASWTQDENIYNSDVANWYVEKDVFIQGAYTIRSHDHKFLRSRESKHGNLELIHENLVVIHDKEELSWGIECTSDDFGALIDQPTAPFVKVAELSPTCNGGSLSAELPSLTAGGYKVIVRSSEYGAADGVLDITYNLVVNNVTPDRVGTGGGTRLVIMGSGFSETTSASLCGTELTFFGYTSGETAADLEMIAFDTVPFDISACANSGLILSSVDAATGNVITSVQSRKSRNGGITVDSSLTPTLTMVNPSRGGTAGGTTLTLTGTGFGTDMSKVTVTMFDVQCVVQSVSDTEIQCVSGPFPRTEMQVKVDPTIVISGGPGMAVSQGVTEADTQFWYIDRWSSPYTWGCTDETCKPTEGDIIVIPQGQVILLDESTPILAVLIVDGGTFIWDDADGIELHMHYGVVNNGGHFEIGTEEAPFCSGNALIKMYGHQRSVNLPIYGAKVLAVRFGSIDIHGCPKTTTWTEMDITAEAGETSITLTHPVKDDWFVGNEIIIAATGDITNFHRSEKRTISSVSEDGYTVHFDEALEWRHIAVCSNGPNDNGLGWGWAGSICTRAEVGLLTRNVKMMGNFHEEWAEDLDECELGVGTAFGVQTCFQNRYGHETGSDQFGSILFLHKPTYAKIEFFEVTHAGQAFNLARYPIHFHTPGALPTSYVRGCGIHNTFNRALTMHGVHNLTVEYNVIYNVMGLAFFLEDAVEENNILRYNLGIMNKKSSSLLNIDSTPAVFWIPNPNNIFYGNHAAGGSHFGFWFNPPDHPTGPSAQEEQYANFCVKNRPLGQFYNNTAHSMGKYGLWIFTDLTPTGPHGVCGETTPKAIKFGALPDANENGLVPEDTFGFFAWHCQRGAEFATGGAIQFHNMIVANNWKAGLAGKETFLETFATPALQDQTTMFKRNIAIGHLDGDIELRACGDMGIETPWKNFAFTVDDIQFYNYDNPTPNLASVDLDTFGMAHELDRRRCLSFDPCYEPNAFDCGATTWFSNVTWYNSNRRMTFAWEHEAAILDVDGTFTEGDPGTYVIAKSDAFDSDLCTKDTSGKYMIEGKEAHICQSKNGKTFKPHRFMFNQASPDSLEGSMAVFENEHGITKSPFRNCRPRGNGWMVMLNGNDEYSMHFENFDHISNISFAGDVDDFELGEWMTIRHDFPEKIDYADLKKGNKESGERIHGNWPSDPLSLTSYDYHVTNLTQPYSVRYTFNGQENSVSPQVSKDNGALTWGEDFGVNPNFYKCFFLNCIPPPPEPPTEEVELEDCNFLDCLGLSSMPEDFSDLHVVNSMRMMVDRAAVVQSLRHLKFGSVFVDGTLEIAADTLQAGEHLIIEADHLVINTGMGDDPSGLSRKRRATEYINNGKIVIGTAENPIPCDVTVEIRINGDQNSRSFGALSGLPPIGAKALGGFGGIEMHGCAPETTWTTLTNTVNMGASSITVNDDITGWKIGDEIVIASSDYEHRHTEYFSIVAINGLDITLNTTMLWRHLGSATTTNTYNGKVVDQAAEVALLTRNIRIDGSGGAESKVGGRVVIFSWIENIDGHEFVHQGYGQFENVEFKGMGQFGYTNYDDLRAQILFWDINPTEDLEVERRASYVKGCAFHNGFHTAVAAMFDTDNLLIDNNIIFGVVDDAIRTDSIGVQITNNVIGNVHMTALWQNYFEGTTDANFEEDQLPACINTGETEDALVQNNRCAGSDGACFEGKGEQCTESESCTVSDNGAYVWVNNQGHSCSAGFFNIKYRRENNCAKFAGFYFYKIAYYGIVWISGNHHMIVEDTIIIDAQVGIFGVATSKGSSKTNTIKNSYISGRSDNYDCTYDMEVKANLYLSRFAGSFKPPLNQHVAMIFPEFFTDDNGFPVCAIFGADLDVNVQGLTCYLNTHFADYNRKCGVRDHLITANPSNLDWTFPVHLISGNTKSNINSDDLVNFIRPVLDTVNIADCSDLYCDGLKKGKIQDFDGGVFDVAGTIMAESEFEWDGVSREDEDGNTVPYSNTQDGLGDYRIPKPLLTRLDGSKIPVEELVNDYGVVRGPNCEWRPSLPGWFCPKSDAEYYDLIYEMLDEDKDRRRLTPLAILSDTGYIDITNGPGDHSCCIGYACQIRLMTIHTTVACGVSYDYYFSSTTPLSARIHFPDAPENCLIKIQFYSKRPNRIDLAMDGAQVLASNAEQNGENIEWSKPDAQYIPTLGSSTYGFAGANYHERNAQIFHFIVSGGHTYDLNVVSTLVLELGVMTELTEDEFYDNGNLAANIAALLGIDPSKIRVMNVIREDSESRRKRRAIMGFETISVGRHRFRRNGANTTALQFEIDPPSKTVNGATANNNMGANIANMGSSIVNSTLSTIQNEMNDETATAEEELAVAAAPVPPATPEEPVTLADQLGIDNIEAGDDLQAFLELIQDELDVPLNELETAGERQDAEQAEADAAMEPIVYTTPSQLIISSGPTDPQILNLKLYQKFVINMKDSNGNLMPNVGFVTEPWTVSISLSNTVTNGDSSPSIDGTTVVQFKPADGRATFDNVVIKGDVSTTEFIFTVMNPADGSNGGVSPISSTEVEFLPPADDSTCSVPQEGSPFDKKQAWTSDCSYTCLSPCQDLGGLTDASPKCETVNTCAGLNISYYLFTVHCQTL